MDPGRQRRRRARPFALAVAAALTAVACGPAPSTSPLHSAACARTFVAAAGGVVTDARINEASGMVASRTQPGVFWVHNDSGDSPRIFAIDTTGATRAVFEVAGATATDWEDIAMGPGPVAGVEYLYIGDIGDNSRNRTSIQVYRVPEPTVPTANGTYTLSGAARLNLTYPNGARNAESLLVDPRNAEITVVMKRVSNEPIRVYRAPANLAAGSTTAMIDVGGLALPGTTSNATGIDITRDARAITLRTYANVYVYNNANLGTVQSALATLPCAANTLAEAQGETIAIHADDNGYTTLSEGTNRPLNNHDV